MNRPVTDNQENKFSLVLICTYLLAYLLTHSLTYSLTHSLTYLLTHSLTHLLTYLLTYSLTHSLIYSLIYLFTHSLTHLPTYLFITYLLTQLITHLLTQSLTHSLTYLLTVWKALLLAKLTGFQLVKKFSLIYGNRRFIAAFTSARHLSLSSATSIQSTPTHPSSWRSILILSSHLILGLQSDVFPHISPPKACIDSPLPRTRYLPRPPHSSWFVYPSNIGWAVKIIKLP